ncbi:MAG TPA: hypothetical protein VGF38_13725 [Ktedonobacterales bacterium]|jgi:hypothetical protein
MPQAEDLRLIPSVWHLIDWQAGMLVPGLAVALQATARMGSANATRKLIPL